MLLYLILLHNVILKADLDALKPLCSMLSSPYYLQWDAFSLPELNNFVMFLENEEQQQISLIRKNVRDLRDRMVERMQSLSSKDNPIFRQSGASMLY